MQHATTRHWNVFNSHAIPSLVRIWITLNLDWSGLPVCSHKYIHLASHILTLHKYGESILYESLWSLVILLVLGKCVEAFQGLEVRQSFTKTTCSLEALECIHSPYAIPSLSYYKYGILYSFKKLMYILIFVRKIFIQVYSKPAKFTDSLMSAIWLQYSSRLTGSNTFYYLP